MALKADQHGENNGVSSSDPNDNIGPDEVQYCMYVYSVGNFGGYFEICVSLPIQNFVANSLL